ncbi:MAG: alpha/beta hydrolase [Bacteroidales bacterium]|nr:alpha/beta hydrolase [Bacteroidales bacterium]
MNIYGKKPHTVILIHGGPGAIGELKPIAEELSRFTGVIETEHYGLNIEEQITEVDEAVEAAKNKPLALLGHSWGAWLACLYAAGYPQKIHKLILVACGPFEASYARNLTGKRLERLTHKDKLQINKLMLRLPEENNAKANELFGEIGQIIRKADTYHPIKTQPAQVIHRYDVFKNVWHHASQMRDSGELLGVCKQIQCPVTAIHGDYDPHPPEGVKEPLNQTLENFRFHLLKNCGHDPWNEYYAAGDFFRILKEELSG